MNYIIGVDVGTSSVRAGIFDQNGKLIIYSVKSIQIWNPGFNRKYFFENLFKKNIKRY